MGDEKLVGGGPTGAEIEERLSRHYLYTDGGAGSGPLTFIDASPGALQEVLGEDPHRALARSCGPLETVASVLAHGWHIRSRTVDAPGYFRYLVLTCAVVASADDNPDTQDFGSNLRRLLGAPDSFAPRRQALPGLWQSLAKWSASARERGQPVREVVLPARGVGVYIGLTNAIAFPGWRDLRDLRRWFEAHPARARDIRRPIDVATELCPAILSHEGFTDQLVVAAGEYASLFRRGTSMLHLHRLWEATCRALERSVDRGHDAPRRLRLELEVAPFARDTCVRIVPLDRLGAEDTVRGAVTCRVEGARSILASFRGERSATDLCARLDAGVVPFVHERFGVWAADSKAPATGTEWLYLVESRWLRVVGRVALISIDERWSIVGPVGHADAVRLHRLLALDAVTESEPPEPLRIEGGVRTRFGWLGRQRLLPVLRHEGCGQLRIEPVELGKPEIRIEKTGDGAVRVLSSQEPVCGVYRVSLTEQLPSGTRLGVERLLRFVEDAPEHQEIVSPTSRWDDQPECVTAAHIGTRDKTIHREAGSAGDVQESPLDDLLEVIYARGRAGWGEPDLVGLIKELVPGPSPWDILRSLEEGRWLRRTVDSRWRATRWWLVPPRLVSLDGRPDGDVLLEGSCPRVVLQRFRATVAAMGGQVRLHDGVGPMATVTPQASGVDHEALAAESAWLHGGDVPFSASPAPRCWPPDAVDEAQHELHETWDWRSGTFARPAVVDHSRVRLDRWVRRDRPDIFTIRHGDGRHLSVASRTVAVAESFRLAHLPMFSLDGDLMRRIPMQGHLPMHLAVVCRRSMLRASGPVVTTGGWSYAYAAGPGAATAVQRCLGRHFLAVDGQDDPASRVDPSRISKLVSKARRRGLPVHFPTDHRHT